MQHVGYTLSPCLMKFSHLFSDSTPANSLGWCRLLHFISRVFDWAICQVMMVTTWPSLLGGVEPTKMLVDTKLKLRLSPKSSNVVTTAFSTHPGASLIEATKGSQCWSSIAQVRYIEILTRLRGLLVIFLYLVSLCSTLFWELRDNGVVKNVQICP